MGRVGDIVHERDLHSPVPLLLQFAVVLLISEDCAMKQEVFKF